MIRNNILFYFCTLVCLVAIGCSSKSEHHEAHGESGDSTATGESWKEMDEFHMIMAASFHPFKDSADLAPAKAKAAEMAAAARKWVDAPLPEKVNNEETKTRLNHLNQGVTAFVETVKSGDDKAIGDALTELHNLFHELQESWYAGGHGDHHEHH